MMAWQIYGRESKQKRILLCFFFVPGSIPHSQLSIEILSNKKYAAQCEEKKRVEHKSRYFRMRRLVVIEFELRVAIFFD